MSEALTAMHTTETTMKTSGAGTTVPVRQAALSLAFFYILVLALNGAAMLRSAEQLPYGKIRNFWTSVLRPLATFSNFSRLAEVRRAGEQKMGDWLNN